jgi:uncharacterized protein (DUF111 family)
MQLSILSAWLAGLDLLGVEQVFASPIPLGAGWVRSAHGPIPVPAPATLALLASAGAPVTADETPFELTTPTGAAILAALATFRRPPMRLRAVGYGFGARRMERPNALRVWLGDMDDETDVDQGSPGSRRQQNTLWFRWVVAGAAGDEHRRPASRTDRICHGAVARRGALDVWCTPIMMKKGRVGVLIAALVPADLEDQMVTILLRETTTLGVRRRAVERYVCERDIITVTTPLGPARIKRKRWRGELIGGGAGVRRLRPNRARTRRTADDGVSDGDGSPGGCVVCYGVLRYCPVFRKTCSCEMLALASGESSSSHSASPGNVISHDR